jgi:purine-nucleoside phosphorylase
MKNKREEGIIKPQPIRGFGQKTVLYIPVDLPSFKIQKVLKKRARKTKNTPLGQLYDFENKAVLTQCVGAPLAVLTLERMIRSGAQEIIILGFCGGLDEFSDIGEAVSITASVDLKAHVENTLSERRLSFVSGSVVSTDAPFRETQTWLVRNRARGIGYVDMETSAVFALADFYGIQAAALHLVSDQLTSYTHRIGFHSQKLAQNIQKYFLPFIDPGM